MSPSLASKARGRAIDVAGAIRGLLSAAEAKRAADCAAAAKASEAKKVRNWRAGDAMRIDARLAGVDAATAALLAGHVPARAPGASATPTPEELLAIFEAAYEKTLRDALEGGQS
jgi:hypothetical protein